MADPTIVTVTRANSKFPGPPIHGSVSFDDETQVDVAFGATVGFEDFLPGSVVTLQTTEDCYVTFDGTAPSIGNGIALTAAMGPVVFPYALPGLSVIGVSESGTLLVLGNALSATITIEEEEE